MTVAELKAELAKYPDHYKVMIQPIGFEVMFQPIREVIVWESKGMEFVGLSANPPEVPDAE